MFCIQKIARYIYFIYFKSCLPSFKFTENFFAYVFQMHLAIFLLN